MLDVAQTTAAWLRERAARMLAMADRLDRDSAELRASLIQVGFGHSEESRNDSVTPTDLESLAAPVPVTSEPHHLQWVSLRQVEEHDVGRIYALTSPPALIHDDKVYVWRRNFDLFDTLVRSIVDARTKRNYQKLMASMRAPERTEATHDSAAYFIQAEPGTLIKIGVSTNPAKRFQSIRTGNPNVRLLATMPGKRRDEQRLHLRFAKLRHKGEWFRPAPELLAFIDSLEKTT